MRLSALLEILRHESLLAADEHVDLSVLTREFDSVTEDSRRVGAGSVFVAVRGERTDGHDFLNGAREKGAVAVLGDRPGIEELNGLPYVHVHHSRRALGVLAHALLGYPSRTMKVIGVTGTNGKSSTVVMLGQLLESFGHRPATFGTLGYRFGGTVREAPHTTPFGEDLARLFGEAKGAGITHVVMEVSSHSLEQERVAGIDFGVAVFTNLTQDHLDYHPDMEAYRDEKLKLFERVSGPNSFTVVNADDPNANMFEEASPVPCYRFGDAGDCRAENVRNDTHFMYFDLVSPWGEAEIRSSLMGKHNVSNLLAAIATCGGLGLPIEWVSDHVHELSVVPGRFERVDEGQDFHVIVDYAHTEDGLRNVLGAARAVCTKRIITVFGCGGDRDRGKRPEMAAAAAELSDYSIITTDNPRTEDPGRILHDTEAGMLRLGKKTGSDYDVIPDRAQAIQAAVDLAKSGDLVLIAGKGHEDYQIIGTERFHFDDREVAKDVLNSRAPAFGKEES